MKDHPAEDILEKLEDVQDQLEAVLVEGIKEGLKESKWDQSKLNELFHALKKIEKRASEEERVNALEFIKQLVA
ncbi:group-specific protein [Ammoniphilus sp. YIM 78166]|uniref:group-specific protein n=1 Tax=Ammoniphilus sp. YIM 78166 TaxID=1644106 RepID=UPI00142F6ACB|nr:group-specific protein [Ammoniphilus sp. YIM 78166]